MSDMLQRMSEVSCMLYKIYRDESDEQSAKDRWDQYLAVNKAIVLLKVNQGRNEAKWEKLTGVMPPEYAGHYACSQCGWHGKYMVREHEYKFCPECGSKMEAENKEKVAQEDE